MTIRSVSRVILQRLHEIRQRLLEEDATLHTVHLWPDTAPILSSTYIAMFLEETPIQEALQDCLKACAASRVVTTLYLGNLPEPDLEAALLTLSQGGAAFGACALQKLFIGPLNASSSISSKVLTKLLQKLRSPQLSVLDCSCRVRLPNQAAANALAAALRQLPSLRDLRLHVVPRTSIERPSLRLDPLLDSCQGLERLDFTAGYPEHNPYQQAVVHGDALARLIPRNPLLKFLALRNLGLTSAHVHALMARQWPEHLEVLHLPSNTRLGRAWTAPIAQQLQDPRHTTLKTVTTSSPKATLEVDVWTTLNRLGRAKLVDATEGSAEHAQAWQDLICSSSSRDGGDSSLRLNMLFTLIRQHPSLAVQNMA